AVEAIDVIDGENTDIPFELIDEGMTVALLGSSGAGRSTVANHLLHRPQMATAPVRSRDDRGRNTTTHRELLLLPEGGLLIDNPGMRELGLWLAHDGLQRAFADIEPWSKHCHFGDCRHRGEPGCAVQEAVEAGRLDRERLDSFHRLSQEAAATALRRDVHARRARNRRRSKMARRTMKAKRRRGG
ncbi:MAG: ribosome small subunit-dependent GTPase A, partial [Myxococcota bacterium]